MYDYMKLIAGFYKLIFSVKFYKVIKYLLVFSHVLLNVKTNSIVEVSTFWIEVSDTNINIMLIQLTFCKLVVDCLI